MADKNLAVAPLECVLRALIEGYNRLPPRGAREATMIPITISRGGVEMTEKEEEKSVECLSDRIGLS